MNILAFGDCHAEDTFFAGIRSSVGLCVVNKFMHIFSDELCFIMITENSDAGWIAECAIPDTVKAVGAFCSGIQDLADSLCFLEVPLPPAYAR